MKINRVEQLVGITKKNIRFYEEQGLLNPGRNRENGYREYSEDDVRTLEQIKLLRKLGLPLDEIRLMQSGKATVADGMRRRLIAIQREQSNLRESAEFCERLKGEEILLQDLDAAKLLEEMQTLEKRGTAFRDVVGADVKRIRYAGAIGASCAMILLMVGFVLFLVWMFRQEPEAPPLGVMIVFLGAPIAVVAGVLLALRQRIGEIKKGEVDDARNF